MLKRGAWLLLMAAGLLSFCLGSRIARGQDGSSPQPGKAVTAIPAFAVISVKEDKADSRSGRAIFTEEGISVQNFPLLNVIRMAYDMVNSVDTQFVDVPNWAKTERFDIEAKVDASDLDALHKLTRDQRRVMLQGLLADRFGFKGHVEQREQPVYLLVVAKGGPLIKKVAEMDPAAIQGPTKGTGVELFSPEEIRAKSIWMSALAMMLTQVVHRLVIDSTGLNGNYDVTLSWSPELDTAGLTSADPGANADATGGPSIFTAVQEQLGLRLEPAKRSADALVIDRLEQPTAN